MKKHIVALGILMEVMFLCFYFIKFLTVKWGVQQLFLDESRVFTLTFLVLGVAFVIYIFSAIFGRKANISYKYVFAFSVIFNLSLLFVWNLGSNDLYTHIQRGRMITKYSVSPYVATYDNFKYDQFYEETKTVWSAQLSIYGPAFTLFGGIVSYISQDSLLIHILIYKLIYSILNILTGFFIYKLTKNSLSALLFSWNPAVIFEIQANNHFEILTVFPLVLSLFVLLQKTDWKKYVLSLSILTIGSLMKYVSFIIYPFYLLYILRSLKSLKDKLLFLLIGGGFQLVIMGLIYLPFLDSGINLKGFFELANGKFISPSFGILLLYNSLESLKLNKELAQPIMQNLFKIYYVFLGLKSVFVKKFLEKHIFVKTLILIFTGFTLIYLNLILPWYTLSLLALLTIYYGLSKNTKYIYFTHLLSIYSFFLYIRVK